MEPNGAPSPVTAPAPRRRPSRLDRFFGRPIPPSYPPDGVPHLPDVAEPEAAYLAAALTLATVVALILEWIVAANPVPPGGDSGQWIAASLPYINRPYPSQVIFLGYPPLTFPFLGAFYALGGSAMASGQIFIAVGAVLLGLSTYFLARSMVRRPIIALLVEGFVLLNGPFLRLFFFGGYPTIVGFVFLELAFGCAVRWLQSYRPLMLYLTWTCAAAAVLSHSLVGLVTVATLVFAAFVLLIERALPKQVLFSRAGAAGAATFAIGVGGYYGVTHVLHIAHPNYLQQGVLATKTNLDSLLYPFRLNSLPGIFGHHAVFSAEAAFGLAIVFGVAVFFLLAFLAVRRRLPPPVLIQGSFLFTILAAGVAGWALSIVTDYRRFAYFVYIPLDLGLGWVFDYLLSVFLNLEEGNVEAPGLPPLPPKRARTGIDPITVGIAAIGIAGMLVVGGFTTIPDWKTYETQYTGDSHGPDFLAAVDAISHDGQPGSIFTDNGQAQRWGRAILDRNTYAPGAPNEFVFYGTQILDFEESNWIVSNLYGVSDGSTIASVAALNGTYFTGAPLYDALRTGVQHPTLRVSPGSLFVDVNSIGSVPVSGNAPIGLWYPDPGRPVMVLQWVDPQFNVTETVTPNALGPGLNFSFEVTQTGPHGLHSFIGDLATPLASYVHVSAPTGTRATGLWSAPGLGGSPPILTTAVVSGANTSSSVVPEHANVPPLQTFAVHSGNVSGSAALFLNISVSTPGASNLIPNLPPILIASSILLNWGARFLLLDAYGAAIAAYFTAMFGAVPLAAYPSWSVYTLPLAYPPPPLGAERTLGGAGGDNAH